MKERLVQLLDLEQLTPSKFADIIGVQRSSVSHLISGRNNPSFDFLQKTLRAFPGLRADWLLLGDGTMYEQMGRDVSGNLFAPTAGPAGGHFPEDLSNVGQDPLQKVDLREVLQEPQIDAGIDAIPAAEGNVEPNESAVADTARKIVQIMILYDDDTFKSFRPSH